MSVGENIRELRRREQLSQIELAEALGVSKETVSRWENDRMAVRQRHITRLCELFSVSPDDISSEGMGLSSRAMIRRGETRDVAMAIPGLFPAYRIVEGPSGSSLKTPGPRLRPHGRCREARRVDFPPHQRRRRLPHHPQGFLCAGGPFGLPLERLHCGRRR